MDWFERLTGLHEGSSDSVARQRHELRHREVEALWQMRNGYAHPAHLAVSRT
jgi:hypothetical protein